MLWFKAMLRCNPSHSAQFQIQALPYTRWNRVTGGCRKAKFVGYVRGRSYGGNNFITEKRGEKANISKFKKY